MLSFDYDLYLEIDYECRLKTKLCYKRDDFSFTIEIFSFLKQEFQMGEVEIITS